MYRYVFSGEMQLDTCSPEATVKPRIERGKASNVVAWKIPAGGPEGFLAIASIATGRPVANDSAAQATREIQKNHFKSNSPRGSTGFIVRVKHYRRQEIYDVTRSKKCLGSIGVLTD